MYFAILTGSEFYGDVDGSFDCTGVRILLGGSSFYVVGDMSFRCTRLPLLEDFQTVSMVAELVYPQFFCGWS